MKVIIIVCLVVVTGTIAIAEKRGVKATPLDLYAKDPVGSCIRLVNGFGDPSPAFSDSNPIGCSAIRSVGCTWYTLWDNAACSTSNGGKQVAFL